MRTRLKYTDFTLPSGPVDGLVLALRGQRYQYLGMIDHQARDGRMMHLAQWVAPCRTCGEEFLTACLVNAMPQVRNCLDCR